MESSGNIRVYQDLIEYIFKKRGDKLLIIKVGAGGDIQGYQGKYLKIMQEYLRLDYSVLICSNPLNISDNKNFELTILLADDLMQSFNDYLITYFGHSKGAYQGAVYGYSVKKITTMILINSPMIINYDKQIRGLNLFDGDHVYVYYGTNDYSFKYFELFKKINNEIVDIKSLEGVDHDFTDNVDLFIRLACKSV